MITHRLNYISIILLIVVNSQAWSQIDTRGASSLSNNTVEYDNTKALIIGVSSYLNIPSLSYAHTDALNFYNYLTSEAGGLVDTANIKLLLNSNATAANIFAALDWLVDEICPGERTVIYFSGHGDLEMKTIRQNGFLLAHDSPVNCYMAGGTVGVGYLQDYLETIGHKSQSEVLLITDACRSGKLAGGFEGAQNTSAALAQNWQSITKVLSSQVGEFSYEADKWGNGAGVFTYYLVRGLIGLADRNRNSEVNSQELFMYLLENIGRETNYKQNPIFVGNMTTTLSLIDSLTLATLDHNTQFGQQLLATKSNSLIRSITNKELNELIGRYSQCIKNDQLIPEYSSKENAWDLYQKILNNQNANDIHKETQRSLLAALQNKSQLYINLYIDALDIEDSVNSKQAAMELNYANRLIDADYLLHNDIKSRLFLFESLQASENSEKIRLLQTALQFNPEAAYILNQLGLVYTQKAIYDSALYYFKKTLEMTPTWPYPNNNIGIAYARLGDNQKAIEHYQKAIELKPDYTNAYYNLGIVYRKNKEYKKAIDAYKHAIELKPNDTAIYNNLALVYNDCGQYANAISTYEKALEIAPNYATACNGLGNMYASVGNYDEAIDYYLRAIQIKPDYAFAYNGLGNAYNVKGKVLQAIDSYEKAIEYKPDYISTYLNLGLTFIDEANYEKAIKVYQKALEQDSVNYNVHFALGNAYKIMLQPDIAIKFYIKAIEINPDLAKGYSSSANVYYNMELYEKAIKYYQLCLNIEPDNVITLNYLATISLRLERYGEAIPYYKKILQLEPNTINAYTSLGYCNLYLDNPINAENEFMKAVKLDADNPLHYYNLACFYSLTGDTQNALNWLEQSFVKGFNNWEHLMNDSDLDNIEVLILLYDYKINAYNSYYQYYNLYI